ncbi:MAG: isoprenylcysteine carboxylmethyltransferase family protein [Eudoraea sp.]|nr:isoprenylcysteine carboxylmethyltransferase family protein [Eudoraea sp.]
MNPIFIVVYASWFLSEIIFIRLLGIKKTDRQKVDRGSLWLIWVLIIIGNVSAVFITNFVSVPIGQAPAIGYMGLLLILLGVSLRIGAIRSLGKFFTLQVTIQEDHQLKTNGYYKYIRDPSYTASLISFIGFGVSLNHWISVLLAGGLAFIAFAIRIQVEEKVLLSHFGATYNSYKSKTKAIIPFIY